jgi:hypothetical protein
MKKISHHIGHILAQVQDTFDLMGQWAFRKIKSVSKKAKKEDHPIKQAIGKAGQFLGEAGDTFYNEYERIKNDRKDKES